MYSRDDISKAVIVKLHPTRDAATGSILSQELMIRVLPWIENKLGESLTQHLAVSSPDEVETIRAQVVKELTARLNAVENP